MRISDWSSDVCSSDLLDEPLGERRLARACGTGDQDVEPALHRKLEKFDVPSRMKQAEQFFLDGAEPLGGDLRFREQAAGLEICHGDRKGARINSRNSCASRRRPFARKDTITHERTSHQNQTRK